MKEIYGYFIFKILNQEKEGIKQLEEDEFSSHLILYRSFGIFMNSFCFNNSLINNCTILESINFFKKNFFESQEQVEIFVDICLKDYFKLLGFLAGTKNNFFNYYDRVKDYFNLYILLYFYPVDFTMIKYLFVLSEKNIDLNSFLKLSNIENVYSKFDQSFNSIIIQTNNKSDEKNELNIIMQWETLFEFLITIIKDDSSCYWNLINNYHEVISSKTRTKLYENIRKNKYAIEDLKNILQEKIILNIISEGNLIDKKNLDKKVDEYLLLFFEDSELYNQTLEKLTFSKKKGETKIYYLKDEYLKYFDCNFYVNNKDKSSAQKYILDFKKDIIKTYNYHYYNQSELTFEFFELVYERVLLNKDNLELLIKVVEKLLNNENIIKHLDKKSLRNSLLPIILNYLLMFSVINTKSFIEFKMQNKDVINILYNLLFKVVNNNEINNNVLDKDLEDYIKEVLNRINQYQIIFDYFQGDLNKLNKYNYNINILEQLKQQQNTEKNYINIIPENINQINEKKQKAKNLKDKLKSVMKNKSNNLMKKIETNEDLIKSLDEQIKNVDKINQKNEEIICFYCRNPITLDSFEVPYGKLGLYFKDLFYTNSIEATIREEIKSLKLEQNNINYEQINYTRYTRLISCGHYFHSSCFSNGCKKNSDDNGFDCPICLKNQNIKKKKMRKKNQKMN